MARLMDRETVRSRSRDKKGGSGIGGMRGWSDSDSDEGKFRLKAPLKLAPVSGWKQAENKKAAGSQDIFLRPAPVPSLSSIRLVPRPGQEEEEEEGSDGEKVRKPVASRGKALKAASGDDLAHVRSQRKDKATPAEGKEEHAEDAPKASRKPKEDISKDDKPDTEKESKKRRDDDNREEGRGKKDDDRDGKERAQDDRHRRGDRDREKPGRDRDERDRREKPREKDGDRRDRRDDRERRDRRDDGDRRDKREDDRRDRGRDGDKRGRDRSRDRGRR